MKKIFLSTICLIAFLAPTLTAAQTSSFPGADDSTFISPGGSDIMTTTPDFEPGTWIGLRTLINYSVQPDPICMAQYMARNGFSFDLGDAYNACRRIGILNLILFITNRLLEISSILVILFLIYGGYVWITAGGNEEQIKKAHKIILYCILGLIIIFSSYAIVYFILGPTSQIGIYLRYGYP